jgi:hypothetical protein
MELETINKLYLELSQIATAKTSKDLELDRADAKIKMMRTLCFDIFNCDEFLDLPASIKLRVGRIVSDEPAPEGGG